MSKDPAFLFYSKDWLEGTAEYMPEEKGVYIDLLCYQQQRKGLPQETERLAKMVGISHDHFLKIWSVISCHFVDENGRLINKKLQNLIEERTEKGRINTITGTFAGLLRFGGYTRKQYIHLKKSFKATDFYQYPKEEITERLTEWLVLCLKSIGNGNGNEDNNYKGMLSKVLSENEIVLPEGFEVLVFEWLKYKSEKGQSYKETGLKSFIKKFLKDSELNKDIGREMLDYSMSKNYSGLFKEKYENNIRNNQQGTKSVNHLWDKEN